ncbi:MAG TPA: MopE-related protein [Polyangiales bacterium]
MCSYVDSAHRSLGGLLLLALVLSTPAALQGCARDHRCSFETCDGKDNDCDGLTDEGFVDAQGRYVSNEHCGGCGISCAKVFPTAATTECVLQGEQASCRIASCPAGQRLIGGACAPEPPLLCLPCQSNDECSTRSAGALCLPDATGSGRCGRACQLDTDCPTGYGCKPTQAGGSQCRPLAGSCLCSDPMLGAELACELRASDSHVCAGVQHCTAQGLGACEPALTEQCNGQDDDCDGKVDEDFVDAQGRYVGVANCGGCGHVCSSPGPHLLATCEPDNAGARCNLHCADGYVDVDGVAATGCECKLAQGPVIVVGGDGNCDGKVDPTPQLIFVSTAGDDTNDGSDVTAPVRTIARGLSLGASTGRGVLVSRGIYAGPVELDKGVALIGGYSPDFRERDVVAYPVVIEAPSTGDGAPALRCKDIAVSTYVDGLTLVASDAIGVGQGSTALLLDGCTSNVALQNLTVLAARGAAGARGRDSSAQLGTLGLSSLTDLDGASGGAGGPGGLDGIGCPPVLGGNGGAKTCPSRNVSGGDGGRSWCPTLSCDNFGSTPCGNAGCTDFTRNGVCDLAAAKAAAVPNPDASAGSGRAPGTAGTATYAAPTNHGTCNFCDDNPSLPRLGEDGRSGGSGVNGVAGAGCADVLHLDASGRLVADSGQAGANGSDGSGGGGGSGGAGYAVIGHTTGGSCASVAGGGGGGAGSGGCGAPGATGGSGGGASVGVLVRLPGGAVEGPALQNVRVVTASGGDGGDGGIGALGGAGGSGGLGGQSQFWCARGGGRGGDGGPGGSGGGGGGGCGGSTFGVLVLPASPTLNAQPYVSTLQETMLVEVAGSAGRAGRGGFSPGQSGQSGSAGHAGQVVLQAP